MIVAEKKGSALSHSNKVNKKVLIVDDSIKFCRSMAFSLRLKGFDVDICTNPFDAVDLVKGGQFDVVILDYLMPGMDGLKLTKKIKEKCDSVPMVMVTGNRSRAVEEEFKLLGGSIVFDKIFDHDSFLSGLNEIMV